MSEYLTLDPKALELHPEFARLFVEPDEDQIRSLAQAMERVERFKPLLVDQDQQVLAGVETWRAALTLGWRSISVMQAPRLSLASLHALMIAENVHAFEVREEHLWRGMNNFFDMQPLRPPGGW